MKTFLQFLMEDFREDHFKPKKDELGLEPIDPEISNMYRGGVDDGEIIKFISKNKVMTAEEAKEYYAKFVKSKGKR